MQLFLDLFRRCREQNFNSMSSTASGATIAEFRDLLASRTPCRRRLGHRPYSSTSSSCTYASMLSRQAPGQLPLIAFGWNTSVSTVRTSTSPSWPRWHAPHRHARRTCRRSAPTISLRPLHFISNALPMSCGNTARFPVSDVQPQFGRHQRGEVGAFHTKCLRTFWPYDVRMSRRPEHWDQRWMQIRDPPPQPSHPRRRADT